MSILPIPIRKGNIIVCPKCKSELYELNTTIKPGEPLEPHHLSPINGHRLWNGGDYRSMCCDNRWFIAYSGYLCTGLGWVPTGVVKK